VESPTTNTTTRNITFLEQRNAKQRYPNLRNKVQCQNITDMWGTPVLEAADDAFLPSLSFFQSHNVTGGVNDCSALTFSWTTIRTENDQAPLFLTISFMRNNVSGTTNTSRPATSIPPFYKKTLHWPTNNYMWYSDLKNLPWQSEATFQLNEV
jgi:hypothetical protein